MEEVSDVVRRKIFWEENVMPLMGCITLKAFDALVCLRIVSCASKGIIPKYCSKKLIKGHHGQLGCGEEKKIQLFIHKFCRAEKNCHELKMLIYLLITPY